MPAGFPPAGQSCANCKFLIQRGTGPNFYYECHWQPPVIVQTINAWPRVQLADWCGQWIVYS